MATTLFLLALMMGPCAIARIWATARHRPVDTVRAGVVGLALLFGFTGIGHFMQTEAMAQMLPSWIPARTWILYATGILEFAIAGGFLFRPTTRAAGWIAAGALVIFFPANIYAAVHHVPMGGHAAGPVYLWVRAPLQALMLFWVYWFSLRARGAEGTQD